MRLTHRPSWLAWGLVTLVTGHAVAGCLNPFGPSSAWSGLVPLPFLPQQTYQVVPSPDGTRLAYSERAGLFVVDLATMRPRKLAESEGPISGIGWTGDGRSVTFLPSRLPPITEPGEPKRPPAPDYPPGRLQLVNVDTGVISTPAIAAGTTYRVSPSPDGRYLAVLKDPGLYLYDIARDTETHLADVSWQSLAWSPDSRRLAHIAFNEDRTADVVVTAIAEQRSQRITGAGIHMNRMAVEGDCWPAEEKIVWTAGGDRLQIVQNRTPQSFGITTVTLDGQVVENRTLGVADPADNRRYVDCYHPAPDGRFIVAFRFSGDGGIPERNTSLVGIDAGTGQVREVAPPSSFVAWLGRTSRFVVSNNEGGSFRYYVADAAQGR